MCRKRELKSLEKVFFSFLHGAWICCKGGLVHFAKGPLFFEVGGASGEGLRFRSFWEEKTFG